MLIPFETRTTAPLLVFDVIDQFAASRRIAQPRPRPIGLVLMRLTARIDNGVRTTLPEPLKMVMARNAGGFDSFFGDVELPDRTHRARAVGPGSYDISIESQFYQTALLQAVSLPMAIQPPPILMAPIEVRLAPNYIYPFPESEQPAPGGATLLRGAVFRTDGSGIEGAVVSLNGIQDPPPYTTGRSGEWVFAFAALPAGGRVTVHIQIPNQPAQDVANVAVTDSRTSYLRQTALRGQVLNADGSALPGATIRVTGDPGESLSRQDGQWFFYFDDFNQPQGQVRVTAVLPDGHNKHVDINVQPQSTVVVPSFRFP